MYVDKPLTGVAAVQTLSRLNRIHPLKSQDDVRILDFVNQAEDIQAAFEPWFETTITEPTDPNLLYAKEREVMDYELLVASEMESFIRVLGTAGPGRMPDAAERTLHAELHEYLQPALDRFAALETDDEREGFRKALQDFVRAVQPHRADRRLGRPGPGAALPVRARAADPAAGPPAGVGRRRGRGPEPLPAGVHRPAQRVAVVVRRW